jgi:hypothetical protein
LRFSRLVCWGKVELRREQVMASNRQIEANRINAERSTGPRTAHGRAVSSKNALRHGLARGVSDDPGFARCLEALAGLPGLRLGLVEVARTRHELMRVRLIRSELLGALLLSMNVAIAKRLHGLDRFERAALRRQKKLSRLESFTYR